MEENETNNTDDDLNGLFKLPLGEFTRARNALAARLKKAGQGARAERVKALAKPSISAWTVNQLYWRQRDAFDRLIAAGESLRRAHASQLAGKAVELSGPSAARREALSTLSRLAGALLHDEGHNAAPDTMRRITTTLEAVSTYASFSGALSLGRLTHDVDPPGFESLAALISGAGVTQRADYSTRVIPFRPSARAAARSKEDGRETKIAAAKAALKAADITLREVRARAQDVAATLKKMTTQVAETENARRDAEQHLEKASAAALLARQRLQSVKAEAGKAAKALEDAERIVEKAREELLHSMR